MSTFKIPADMFVIRDVSFGLERSFPEVLTFRMLLHSAEDEFWVYRSAFVNDDCEIQCLCRFVADTLYIAGVDEIHLLKRKDVWLDKNDRLGFSKKECRAFVSVCKG